MTTGLGRRARTAAISLLATLALGLTACSGSGTLTSDTEENTVDPALATRFDEAIAAAMQYTASDAAIVGVWTGSQGDYVRAFGDADVAAPLRGAQATQPVMCALLLELAAEGTVPLDRLVSEDLPRQVGIEKITYGQLCTAKSGLADYKTSLGDIFANNPARPWSDRELLAQSLARSPLSWPGLDVHLADTNAVLLARALRVATSRPVSELLQEHVFGPAEMGSSFYPSDTLAAAPLPDGGFTGSTYPLSGGAAVCDAGLQAVPAVSPSMLAGAGATVTTVNDLRRFYEHYLNGSFGGELSGLVTQVTPTANPQRDENGTAVDPPEGTEPDPNAQAWGFGLERLGTLYGKSGAITGTSTAAYHDPGSGFTVIVSLNNSTAGAAGAQRLALQLAAMVGESGNGPTVPFTVEDLGARLAESAVCPPPPEEAPAA